MTVLNKYIDKIPKGAIYIGRGSRWGNPYWRGKHGTRDEVCDQYAVLLDHAIENGTVSLEDLAALHGKDLVCFCAPLRCHGDTLEQVAEWAWNELNALEQLNQGD